MLQKVEFYSLLAGVFFLPLLEAPKNLCLLVFLVCWLINRIKAKNFGGKISLLDISVFALAISGYLSAIFTELHHKEWSGPNNLLLICVLFLMIYRSNYSPKQITNILFTPIVSTGIGIIEALVQQHYLRECTNRCLFELHSVGHVNHSAIYLLLAYGISLSFTVSCWKKNSLFTKICFTTLTAFFAVVSILTESRAAAGGVFIIILLLSIGYLRQNLKASLALFTLLSLSVIGTIALKPPVIEKQIRKMEKSNTIYARKKIWNSGLTAWREYPAWGIGMKNYSQITPEKLQEWSQNQNKLYIPKNHMSFSHAHNLYINTMAEKGTVGLVSLLFFLLCTGFGIVRYYPKKTDSSDQLLFWGTAASAWITITAVGLVNTTLHHEHGILSIIMLAGLTSIKKETLITNKQLENSSGYKTTN